MKRDMLFSYASKDKTSKGLLNEEQLERSNIDPTVKESIKEILKTKPKIVELDSSKPEDRERLLKLGSKVTLEDEYIRIRKEVDLNSWENKRLPRPYEEKFESE